MQVALRVQRWMTGPCSARYSCSPTGSAPKLDHASSACCSGTMRRRETRRRDAVEIGFETCCRTARPATWQRCSAERIETPARSECPETSCRQFATILSIRTAGPSGIARIDDGEIRNAM